MSQLCIQLSEPPKNVLTETYLIEILVPGTDKWLDAGLNSRWKTFEEADTEMKTIAAAYNNQYKFRVSHIVCTECILKEITGERIIALLD
jgi:hypothetical protein